MLKKEVKETEKEKMKIWSLKLVWKIESFFFHHFTENPEERTNQA